jgi:Macrocin-O-methyltransferase (TylF)
MVVRYDETPPAATWNFLEGLAASDARVRPIMAGNNNYENCSASLAQFEEAIAKTHCSRVHIRPGFFEKSFPEFDPAPIAILRLDGDWYESTMICLKKFWHHVLPGVSS